MYCESIMILHQEWELSLIFRIIAKVGIQLRDSDLQWVQPVGSCNLRSSKVRQLRALEMCASLIDAHYLIIKSINMEKRDHVKRSENEQC